MAIVIEDIRYLDKFRPSETDVNWSLYNVGEPYDIEIDYRVEEVAIAESQDVNSSGYIILNPTGATSGVADPTGIIYSDSPKFENFYVGDTVTVSNAFKASNNGTYTVTEKISAYAIRVNTSFQSSFVKTNGTVHVETPFAGHRYYFNWIENSATAQFIEVSSGEENQLYYDSATTALSATSMLWNGNKTNEIEGATIEGNGTSTYGQRFTIKHSGVVTPLFLASQYDNTLARISPDYFEAGNALKHVFRIESNRDLSNPNDTQEITFDDRLGNTGWFNENYNGQEQNYSVSNLTFTRVSDSASLDALELTTQVDVEFRVTNTENSPFDAVLTKGMSLFWILPDDENNYRNNDRTLKENFVYDYSLNTVGSTTNGDNFGTTLQAIEETEITYVDADNIDVRIRFLFGSLAKAIVNENDFKRYLIGFTIENDGLTRETSDKTTLLINVNEFELQLFDANLITNSTVFLAHRFSDFADGVTNPDVFPVDDVVAYSQFNIDFNGLENDGINIINVAHELVLKHASNAEILVESNSYATSATQFLNGYVPIVDVEQNRAFTIEDNDFRRLVTVKRDDANDSGTVFAYETTYPFFVRWETWEALVGVQNPPAGVYDTSLPNNGVNYFLYRYSTQGYTLNYRLRFTLEQNGELFTQEFDSPMTMYDFDSNSEWNNEYIKSYDVASSTELVSGSDKFIQGYVDTRIEAGFDKTVGSLPNLDDVDIVFWIIGKESGTIRSVKRASSFYQTSGDTWFKGITTSEQVDKNNVVTLYTGEILVDFTKISGSEFTIYARLHDNPPTIPADAKFMEDGTPKLTENDDYKILD